MKKYIFLIIFILLGFMHIATAQKKQEIRLSVGVGGFLNVENSFIEQERTWTDKENRMLNLELGHAWQWKKWEFEPSLGYFEGRYVYYTKYDARAIVKMQGAMFGIGAGYYFHSSPKWSGIVSTSVKSYLGFISNASGEARDPGVIFYTLGSTLSIPIPKITSGFFIRPSIGITANKVLLPKIEVGMSYRYKS